MASMYRNTNLEEIEVDSFLGIEFLKYQSLKQKIIFIAGFVVGGGILLLLTLLVKWNPFLSLLCAVPFVGISILFGCNYNQDLSLFRYLVLVLREPVKHFVNMPTEDIRYIRAKAEELDNSISDNFEESSIGEHKKRLRNLIIRSIIIAVVFAVVMLIIFIFKNDTGVHHTI